MQRDMDLVRQILLEVEQHPGVPPPILRIEGYSQEQIGHHVFLMWDAGLLRAIESTTTRGNLLPEASPLWITWNGHEFLEKAREPSRWVKAKTILNRIGSWSFDILKDVLTDLAKKQI
jgi:Hypothetical protein (DUF2513)